MIFRLGLFSKIAKTPYFHWAIFLKKVSCLFTSLSHSFASILLSHFAFIPFIFSTLCSSTFSCNTICPPEHRCKISLLNRRVSVLPPEYNIHIKVRRGSNLNITNRNFQLSDVTGFEPSPCPPSDQHCTTLLSGGLYFIYLIILILSYFSMKRTEADFEKKIFILEK